jgi:hypothetical protein
MGLSILTIPEIINIAKYCQCLANNAASLGAVFGNKLDPNQGLKIYTIRKDVEELYALDPNNTNGVYDLYAMAQTLYGLCNEYALTAIAVIDGGGGSPVDPIDPVQYIWTSRVWTFGDETVDIDNTSTFTRGELVDATQVNVMVLNNSTLTSPPDFTFISAAGEVNYAPNKFFIGDVIAMSFYRKL